MMLMLGWHAIKSIDQSINQCVRFLAVMPWFIVCSYYCTAKASTPVPEDGSTGNPCTANHYCPPGTTSPVPCPDGTYMSNTHAVACWNCTAGHYCVNGQPPADCPAGFYCPLGTGNVWQPCPAGTFSTNTGLSSETECTACTAGYYCSQTNATAVTGECTEGFYCTAGADTPTPPGDGSNTGTAAPCPEGHYCPQKTGTPLKCPLGTYSNVTHLTAASECTPCEYGQFCGAIGLTEPSGPCWAGFFCLRGAQSPNNPSLDSTGGPCPLGHHCPNGTSYPLGCAAGTYSASTGAAECTVCPAGHYCVENSTSYSGQTCPSGHYCPAGTKTPNEFPCPKGYYRPTTGGAALTDCTLCEPGKYCEVEGLDAVTGNCRKGYYCTQGAWSRMPTGTDLIPGTSNSTGGRCPAGTFCGLGSAAPEPCTGGTVLSLSQSSHVFFWLICDYYPVFLSHFWS